MEDVTPSHARSHAAILAKEHKNSDRHTEYLMLELFSSALVSRPRPELRFDDNQIDKTHALIDAVLIQAVDKIAVLVTMDIDPSTSSRKRIPRCHAYMFTSKYAANELAAGNVYCRRTPIYLPAYYRSIMCN